MVTRLILLVIVSKFSLIKQDTLTLVGNQFRKTTLVSKLDKSIIKTLHSLLTRTIIFPNNAGIKRKKKPWKTVIVIAWGNMALQEKEAT